MNYRVDVLNVRSVQRWNIVEIAEETSTMMSTPCWIGVNNIDHMHISGTEPQSLILSQTKKFKMVKSDTAKVPKQVEAKSVGWINPENYNVNQFKTWKILCSQTAMNQPKSKWLHVPLGNLWLTSSDIHQVVENTKRKFL